tara:strand:- start:2585 stop:3010 length:426 start_codon:yes stop_codon:yes gene_type:complete
MRVAASLVLGLALGVPGFELRPPTDVAGPTDGVVHERRLQLSGRRRRRSLLDDDDLFGDDDDDDHTPPPTDGSGAGVGVVLGILFGVALLGGVVWGVVTLCCKGSQGWSSVSDLGMISLSAPATAVPPLQHLGDTDTVDKE